MKRVRRYWVGAAILVLQWLALFVFAVGFFRLHPSAPTSSPAERFAGSIEGEGRFPNPSHRVDGGGGAIFDRMVFMIIDALRYDFVFEMPAMKWLRSALHGGEGVGVIAVAKAPTVTLPRLKALTSGRNPRFLDIVANLDSDTQVLPDSWVQQLAARNKTLLHYGDNTWFRLFPTAFHPDSEGTHSFFVTDTIEVDRNVTRHLPEALQRPDWSLLSLHYLGLDHVGHVGGIQSPLMRPKLEEMDGVAMEIYESLAALDQSDGKSSLFVILGDHGMTDTGNHGGSSAPETETACIFLSPRYATGTASTGPSPAGRIQQVDLAPTISLLLGLPIPRGNTGVLAAELIPKGITLHQRLQMFSQSAAQLAQEPDAAFAIDLLHNATACHQSLPMREECLQKYAAYAAQKSAHLSSVAGEYSTVHLLAGGALAALASLASIMLSVESVALPVLIFTLGAGLLFLLDLSSTSSGIPLLVFVLVAIGWLLYRLSRISSRNLLLPESRTVYPLIALCGTYPLLMFSTAFIEEEHLYWYFAMTNLLILPELINDTGASLCVSVPCTFALLLRILQGWNSTGDAMQGQPDMRNSPLELQYFLLAGSLLGACHLLYRHTTGRPRLSLLLGAGEALLALLYKFDLLPVLMQRIALLVGLALISISRGASLYPALALVFMLILKLHNALPLLALGWMGTRLHQLSRHETAALRLGLIHTAFGVLGGSHIIAAIDLSPAYIGQTRFRPLVTGIVGWCATWAGPILCGALALTIPRRRLLLWRSLVLLALLCSVGLQRHHLFIWSVFAPRLLFEFGWNLFYTILILCSEEDERA